MHPFVLHRHGVGAPNYLRLHPVKQFKQTIGHSNYPVVLFLQKELVIFLVSFVKTQDNSD
jgi:hypothetical protein